MGPKCDDVEAWCYLRCYLRCFQLHKRWEQRVGGQLELPPVGRIRGAELCVDGRGFRSPPEHGEAKSDQVDLDPECLTVWDSKARVCQANGNSATELRQEPNFREPLTLAPSSSLFLPFHSTYYHLSLFRHTGEEVFDCSGVRTFGFTARLAAQLRRRPTTRFAAATNVTNVPDFCSLKWLSADSADFRPNLVRLAQKSCVLSWSAACATAHAAASSLHPLVLYTPLLDLGRRHYEL